MALDQLLPQAEATQEEALKPGATDLGLWRRRHFALRVGIMFLWS